MSLNDIPYLEFSDFRLDRSQKVLLRSGKPVALTPKVFDTLEVLVENRGNLLGKDDLMKMIWRDHFVEESNLTSNIKTLRKALGDDAAKPQFIETVPRRGYRFIADVRESRNGSTRESSKIVPDRPRLIGFRKVILAAMIVLAAGAAFSGYWIVQNATSGSSAPILAASFSSEILSTDGKVHHTVLSRDGKNVFYTSGRDGPQGIWLRQLESSHSVEIIPPSDDYYYGLALSPDGNFLYFARSKRQVRDMGIYRVSIFGGVPTKILSGSEGWMSISPDGSKISFVRCPYSREEYCSLYIADALNGKNERKLVSRQQPIRIADNEFSPDGNSIAFAVGQSQNQGNEFGLSEIDLDTGSERELTPEKFFNIKSLAWLPDQNGMLITAARIPNRQFRIWEVTLPSGSVRSLTTNTESYNRLSLNNDANRLVTTKSRQDFRMYISSSDNFSAQKVLADASVVTFAPNGSIVFASVISGNDEIWSINANGTEQRQLTNNAADDTVPISSADSKWIFFASNRTGNSQVWRMNADGSDQTQITFKEGGRPVAASANGSWIYYIHGVDKTLWRASTSGGGEELVLNRWASSFAVSPDGQRAAFSQLFEGNRIIGIASLTDASIIRTFTLPNQEMTPSELVWMPDGKGIVYVLLSGEGNTLMLQPVDGRNLTKLADLGAENVNSFAVAPDGKTFAIVQGGWKHDAVLIKGLK